MGRRRKGKRRYPKPQRPKTVASPTALVSNAERLIFGKLTPIEFLTAAGFIGVAFAVFLGNFKSTSSAISVVTPAPSSISPPPPVESESVISSEVELSGIATRDPGTATNNQPLIAKQLIQALSYCPDSTIEEFLLRIQKSALAYEEYGDKPFPFKDEIIRICGSKETLETLSSDKIRTEMLQNNNNLKILKPLNNPNGGDFEFVYFECAKNCETEAKEDLARSLLQTIKSCRRLGRFCHCRLCSMRFLRTVASGSKEIKELFDADEAAEKNKKTTFLKVDYDASNRVTTISHGWTPKLEWNLVSPATTYHLEVSAVECPSTSNNDHLSSPVLYACSFSYNDERFSSKKWLTSNRKYYWRVRTNRESSSFNYDDQYLNPSKTHDDDEFKFIKYAYDEEGNEISYSVGESVSSEYCRYTNYNYQILLGGNYNRKLENQLINTDIDKHLVSEVELEKFCNDLKFNTSYKSFSPLKPIPQAGFISMGIDDYEGDIPDLNYSVSDAVKFGEALFRRGLRGNYLDIRDISPNDFLDLLREKSSTLMADGGDLYLYFAGHGIIDHDGQRKLMLRDGESIPIKDLVKSISDENINIHLVTDCCYKSYDPNIIVPDFEEVEKSLGIRWLSPVSEGNAYEAESLQGGVFTHSLLSSIGNCEEGTSLMDSLVSGAISSELITLEAARVFEMEGIAGIRYSSPYFSDGAYTLMDNNGLNWTQFPQDLPDVWEHNSCNSETATNTINGVSFGNPTKGSGGKSYDQTGF